MPAIEVGVSEVSQNLRACKALLQGLLYVQERAVPAMGLGSVRFPKTFAPVRRSYQGFCICRSGPCPRWGWDQ